MPAKVNQVQNTFLYLIPVIVGNALPILTLPIFTRILSVQDYGVYALAQIFALFVNGISNFGLTIGYERDFFENTDKIKKAGLLFSSLVFVLVSCVIFGLFTFVFKQPLSEWIIGSAKYQDILFWSFCATSITSLKVYFLTYFKNMGNAKSYVWYTIDENLISVFLSLYMVVYLRTGVIGLVWGQLIASSFIFILLSYRFLKIFPFILDWRALINSLKLSLPLTPRFFFGIIGSQFDKYMIGLLNTIGGVGVYNIGQKIAYISFTFMAAIKNVFGPQVYSRMFELDENEGGISIGHYLTPFFFISIGGGLMVSLFSEEIILILTPTPYHEAINLVSILSLLYGTYFFGSQPQLIYAKKTIITSLLTFLTIFLNVVINIPFIKMWGVLGAAWGTLLAGIISGCISFVISQRYYRINWEYPKIISIFSLFFLFTIFSMLLRDYSIPYVPRLMLKIFFVGSYFYLGIKINIINKRNFGLIKQFFSFKK